MATHSSVLARRIPGSAEPGGLPSIGSHSRTRLKWFSSSKHCITLLRRHNKIPQTGWLKQQKFSFSQFRGLKVQDQSVGRLGSSGALLRGLQMATFSVCPHSVTPLSHFGSKIPLLLRTAASLGKDPRQWPHFYLIIFLKTLPPGAVTFWSCRG